MQFDKRLEPTPATAAHWERVGMQRRHGVLAPLFSLRSETSVGIGDVADLERLVDWCVEIGATVVQLLPLFDLGPDSAPYGAISAFANDPVYIALDRVPAVRASRELKAELAAARSALEGAARIPYPQVRAAKMAILEAAFELDRERLAEAPDYQAYVTEQAHWLDDYALFRTLREHHHWRSWEDWGAGFESPSARRAFSSKHAARLDFHRYHQWLLDGQLMAARDYAAQRGVLLKGDIPILVGRDSADVWCRPQLFRLDTEAGAPPDYYSRDGQVWGFPTYDWGALWEDDCRFWRWRLAHAERFFDLYRVDHVVGLFRIWTVPRGARHGRDGMFVPSDEERWGDHGQRILTMMLEASTMLPLAEDLGTIPDVCRATLRELGICGTKVVRWERRWHGDGGFIPPSEFHPLSLTTLSTHDTETLRGWWKHHPDDRQLFWESLGGTGRAPEVMSREIQLECLAQTAQGGSLFVIHLLQDLLSPFGLLCADPDDDRINVPGTVGSHNWTWRLPFGLERLIADDPLNSRLERVLRRH